jgi:hypothetical protein
MRSPLSLRESRVYSPENRASARPAMPRAATWRSNTVGRWATDRLPALVAELVRLPVAVLAATRGSSGTRRQSGEHCGSHRLHHGRRPGQTGIGRQPRSAWGEHQWRDPNDDRGRIEKAPATRSVVKLNSIKVIPTSGKLDLRCTFVVICLSLVPRLFSTSPSWTDAQIVATRFSTLWRNRNQQERD